VLTGVNYNQKGGENVREFTTASGDKLYRIVLDKRKLHALQQVVNDSISMGCCLDGNEELIRQLQFELNEVPCAT
jgi:hypothetical protein